MMTTPFIRIFRLGLWGLADDSYPTGCRSASQPHVRGGCGQSSGIVFEEAKPLVARTTKQPSDTTTTSLAAVTTGVVVINYPLIWRWYLTTYGTNTTLSVHQFLKLLYR
jgi:hypothetical protein